MWLYAVADFPPISHMSLWGMILRDGLFPPEFLTQMGLSVKGGGEEREYPSRKNKKIAGDCMRMCTEMLCASSVEHLLLGLIVCRKLSY